MSLKAFHIFFVFICTLLAVGVGFWGIRDYTIAGHVDTLIAGIGSLLGAVGFVVYGVWFLKKLRGVSYL